MKFNARKCNVMQCIVMYIRISACTVHMFARIDQYQAWRTAGLENHFLGSGKFDHLSLLHPEFCDSKKCRMQLMQLRSYAGKVDGIGQGRPATTYKQGTKQKMTLHKFPKNSSQMKKQKSRFLRYKFPRVCTTQCCTCMAF